MSSEALAAALENGSMEELKAKGGITDFIRDFDIETGRTGVNVSIASLSGEQYPDGVTLKCGGAGSCILATVGAAAYTQLSLNITGKKV